MSSFCHVVFTQHSWFKKSLTWEPVEIQKRRMESVNVEFQPDAYRIIGGALNHFGCIYASPELYRRSPGIETGISNEYCWVRRLIVYKPKGYGVPGKELKNKCVKITNHDSCGSCVFLLTRLFYTLAAIIPH